MKIEEFIENGSNLEDLDIKTYVPIVDKAKHINTFIERAVLVEGENNILTTYNSIQVEITRIISAMTLYTNLEIGTADDYDLLMETGLINEIIAAIGGDYEVYQKFFDSRMEDYLREHNGVDGLLDKIIKALDNIDMDKVNTLLSKLR